VTETYSTEAAARRDTGRVPARSYDFIVCGAGAAGSVGSGRLAENPQVRVLLIEAGGTDEVPEVTSPAQWPANLGSARDWAFEAEPNPHLNGRRIPLNMGKLLGGGSSINVGVWARGHKNDWDHFAEVSGDPGWGYESVVEVYKRIEDWQGADDPERRGAGGPIYVNSAQNPQPVAVAMVEAARALGIPTFDSPNGAMMAGRGGAAITDLLVRDGQRSSVFRSYVRPRMGQPNLTVLTNALVSRLVMHGTTVTGVEVVVNGELRRYEARHEVIVSLGAINTPKLLMQSGLGPAGELRRYGIDVVEHLPGVGRNHQDHVAFGCIFECRAPQEVGYGGSEATLYWSSDAAQALPDIFHCQLEFAVPSAETASPAVPAHGWTMFAGLAHPKSRGTLHLTGADVRDPMRIEANTLSHPDDLAAAFTTLELAREIGSDAAFQDLAKGEVLPGKLSRTAMEDYLRNAAVTFWHQSATAKMGRDEMSVVDHQLKVYGIDNLRIADASIMPRITTGNTMAPCVVIGERAADMIRQQHGLARAELPLAAGA